MRLLLVYKSIVFYLSGTNKCAHVSERLLLVRTIDIFSVHPAHNPALVVYVGTCIIFYCVQDITLSVTVT